MSKQGLYRNLNDEDLLTHVAQRQDQEAFNMLYRRYAHLALGVCMKYLNDPGLAQDATQTVFTRIWTDAANYQVRSFRPWFYKVVKNHCLMILRKSNENADLPENILADFMESDDQVHRKIKEEELFAIVQQCLQQLNDYQQVCMKYFYLQQKTYAQTAALLDLTEKEVKSYLQNGRRNMKICIKQKWHNGTL